jgi:hypothetical protein
MLPYRVLSERRLRCCVLVAGAESSFLRDRNVASSDGSTKSGSASSFDADVLDLDDRELDRKRPDIVLADKNAAPDNSALFEERCAESARGWLEYERGYGGKLVELVAETMDTGSAGFGFQPAPNVGMPTEPRRNTFVIFAVFRLPSGNLVCSCSTSSSCSAQIDHLSTITLTADVGHESPITGARCLLPLQIGRQRPPCLRSEGTAKTQPCSPRPVRQEPHHDLRDPRHRAASQRHQLRKRTSRLELREGMEVEAEETGASRYLPLHVRLPSPQIASAHRRLQEAVEPTSCSRERLPRCTTRQDSLVETSKQPIIDNAGRC